MVVLSNLSIISHTLADGFIMFHIDALITTLGFLPTLCIDLLHSLSPSCAQVLRTAGMAKQ